MSEILTTLIEQLYHPDKNVRSTAALQLGTLRGAGTLAAMLDVLGVEPDLYVREDITWALVRIGDAAVLPLIERLRDTNSAIRHHAAHVLSKIGDARAMDGLIEALQDSDATVVSKAAFALGQFKDVKAIPALVQSLGHENRDVQGTIDTVLENFGTAAVQPLIEALNHERCQVREQAADILGLIGDRDTISVLIEALNDPDWQVRFSAVNALGIVGGAEAKQALERMQNDPNSRVRDLASKMIARLKTVRVRPRLQR